MKFLYNLPLIVYIVTLTKFLAYRKKFSDYCTRLEEITHY